MKNKSVKRYSRAIDRQEVKAGIKASKKGKVRNPNGSIIPIRERRLDRQPNDWRDW